MRGLRVLCAAAAVLLVACDAGGEPPPETGDDGGRPTTITIPAKEYSYAVPDEIPAGLVTLDFVNAGEQPHEFGFVRLTQGRTVEDLVSLLTRSGGGNPLWPEEVGGLSAMSPGFSAEMTKQLQPGSYAFFCLLPTPDGDRHVDEGMIAGFRAGPLTLEAEAPEPDVVIVGDEDGYDVPRVDAGRQLVEFRNVTSDTEILFHLTSLNEGQTPQDVTKWYESGYKEPAPVVFPGSAREVAPLESSLIEIEFESGRTYTMADPINGFEVEIEVR